MFSRQQKKDYNSDFRCKVNLPVNIVPTKKKEIEKNDKSNENIYCLDQNIEKLKKPVFVRVDTRILFSIKFPKKQFEEYFIRYEIEFDTVNKDNLIKEACPEIVQNYPEFISLYIEWLTISNTTVEMDHIYVKSKIQLTAKSFLTAMYSIFIPLDISKTESAIEIFANSKAVIKNCHFYNADRVAVIVRNYSSVTFENCVFDNNRISCFIMDDSYAKFISCKFKNDRNISVFVTKNSQCEIINSLFKNITGKAIFAKDSSKVYITNTKFIDCQKGAATIAEKSSLFMDGQILIQKPKNTAIRAINSSHIKALDVVIEDADGNAFNIERSDGYFINCIMKGTIHPTIAVIGQKSNPIFHNCLLLDNKNTFCVICKNCCRPLFDNCTFSDCSTNCISVSDFSRPHIQNCKFENISKYFINSFGGSFVTYENIQPMINKIHASRSARCEMKTIEDVENDDDLLNGNDDDDDFAEKDQGIKIKSWVSPAYDLPPQITIMQDPEIISKDELKPLKLIKMSKIIEKYNDKEISFICSKCHIEMNKNEDEIYFMNPCGHVLCNNCQNVTKCPICDSPVKDIKKIFIEDQCSICLDKSPNTVSLPCGHMCMCYECAVKCFNNNFNCPLCNEPLNSYKYVFTDIFSENESQQ